MNINVIETIFYDFSAVYAWVLLSQKMLRGRWKKKVKDTWEKEKGGRVDGTTRTGSYGLLWIDTDLKITNLFKIVGKFCPNARVI